MRRSWWWSLVVLAACESGGTRDDASDGADATQADTAVEVTTAVETSAEATTTAAETSGEVAQADTIPHFTKALYLDPASVERISRFRSGYGHDFSDSYESCRSMKHYLCMTGCDHPTTWTSIALHSPVDGTIVALEQEQTFGTQVRLAPDGADNWIVRVFHVTPAAGLAVGSHVSAGQLLGHHASNNTMSDIAVEHYVDGGRQLVSWFDTMDDTLFAAFAARGATRAGLVITQAERDADPLSCAGEAFLGAGTLPNWVDLTPP